MNIKTRVSNQNRWTGWFNQTLKPTTAVALALGLLLPATTFAKVSVWDSGYANTGTWQNPANWEGDLAFANNDDVVFGPMVNVRENYLGSNRTVSSLTYRNDLNGSLNTHFGASGTSSSGTMYKLTFNAANTGITIQSGDAYAHRLGNSANTAGADVVLQADLTVTHDGTFAYSIVRPITGNFGLIKTGSGTGALALSGANTYTGDTTITTGPLRLGAANVIPDGAGKGNVFIDTAGTLDLNAKNETVNGLSGTGTVDNLVAGTPTLTIGGNNQNSTFNGVIQNTAGTLSLAKTGLGTISLSGINTYVGATVISAGKLVGPVGGSAVSSAVTITNSGSKLGVSITDNTKSWTCASLANNTGGGLEFNFGAVAPGTSVSPLIVSGAVDFSAATPTVTVKGNNLTAGTFPLMTWTSISGTAPTTASLPTGVTGSLSVVGNTLNLVISSVVPVNVKADNSDSLNLTSSWTLNTVPGASDVAQWDGTVTSPNSVNLGANTTWSGVRIVDPNGMVTINDDGSSLTLGAAATDINMSSATADLTLYPSLIVGAANVWDVAAGQILALENVVSGSGSITKQGGGTATLDGYNTFNGGLTLAAGTLNINNPTALGDAASTFTIAGGTIDNSSAGAVALGNNNPQAWNADVNFLGSQDLDLGAGSVTINANRAVTINANKLTVGGPIGGGAFNLNKAGSGVLTLNGNISLTGVLNMNAGTLTLAGANTFSAANLAGGTLNINNDNAIGSGTVTISSPSAVVDNTSGGLVTLPNNPQAWNADFTFAGTYDLNLGTGPVALGAARTLTVNGGGGRTLTVGGVMSGAFGFTKSGPRNLVLNGLNTYTGQTLIFNGILKANTIANVGVASSLGAPTTAANGLIQLGNGGTGNLEYTGTVPAVTDRQIRIGRSGNGSDNGSIVNNNADSNNTLTFSNPSFNAVAAGSIATGPRTLTLSGSNPGRNTIQGAIVNNNSSGGADGSIVRITKSGSGTWVLAGANTYTGPTTISDGKLVMVVGGSSASSSVLMSGASGTLGISITDNIKQWVCANLTNTAGGIMEFDFGSITPSLSTAPLAIYGEADFNFGTPTVNIVGDFIPVGTFPLMTWNTTSGTAPNYAQLPPGVVGSLNLNGNTLELVITTGSPSFIKANNTISLNQGTSWVDGVAPGSSDTPVWDNTVTSANATSLGMDTAWKRIKILNPAGLVTINAGNTLTLSSPDKEIDMSAATANLTLNCPLIMGDANVWDVTYGQTLTLGGQVSGSASVTKSGDGTAMLSAANSYSGATIVNGGTLALSGAGTLGNGTSLLALNGGALDLGNLSRTSGAVVINVASISGDTLKNGSLTGSSYAASVDSGDAVVSAKLLGAGDLSKTGAGTLTLANTNTYAGTTIVNAGTLTLRGSSVLPATNAISLGAATLMIRNDKAGTINHGNLNITATGATVDIGNLSGVTTGCTVAFGNFVSPLTATLNATAFTSANGYNLSFTSLALPGASGQTTTLTPSGTSITVTGNVTNRMNAFATNNWDTLVLSGDSTGNQILGVIGDSAGTNTSGLSASLANGGTTRLTKSGVGTWTLEGANTYTGATTVNGGTLLVNNSVASPIVTVNNATLGGTGSLAGAVSVTSGGTVQPGVGSTGTLTINNTLNIDGTASFVLNRANAQNSSRIVGLTSRTNTGTLTVVNIGPAIQANDTFTLFSGGTSTGDFAATNLPDITPLTWNLNTAAGTLTAVGDGSSIPTTGTNLTFGVSGGVVTLSWPTNYLGWSLQVQTNLLNKGLSTNWVTIPGTEGVTSTNFPVSTANPAVFYRMFYQVP